jgi:predicted nucleotide-binding protein (sugar kinase/HSP70/actin superfamily)
MLAHGHISALKKNGVTNIFYPCLPYEQDEGLGGDNHYNCPVVWYICGGYSYKHG